MSITITDKAVDEAVATYLELEGKVRPVSMRAAMEAALPHMVDGADELPGEVTPRPTSEPEKG